jgi:hypothetical protein
VRFWAVTTSSSIVWLSPWSWFVAADCANATLETKINENTLVPASKFLTVTLKIPPEYICYGGVMDFP